MITIYGRRDSGNCYKPRLLCALLELPFTHVEIDSEAGETRSTAFLAKNPNGKVPLLELGDGRTLAESNAMLLFLDADALFVPLDTFVRAKMFEWLFFEQYSHEPFVAVRRALLIYPGRAVQRTPERLAETLAGGEKALGIMERQLLETPFLVGNAPSHADLALYAYTHVAGDGGFDLSRFPAVSSWLERVAALPGYRPIGWLPDGTA